MFRHSPSRNQRSKGFKIKQALQICLLLAVCTWLLYQIKHSYDKKKVYDETSKKISETMEDGHEVVLKLGRKDLHPRVVEDEGESKNDDQEDENKNEDQEDESKNGSEEEGEEENTVDESEEEGRGGGDDEIDEQDQERAERDTDRGDDFVDEEEKRRDEKEISEDQNREKNTREAREENYMGDDASSAVIRERSSEEQDKYTEKIELTPKVTTKSTAGMINSTTAGNAETRTSSSKNQTDLSLENPTQNLDSNATLSTTTENSNVIKEDPFTANEDIDEVQNVSDDSSTSSSIPLEEKEDRIDLGTLPETDTIGRNSEDAEAE
ncbi:hypothetical protein GIB67_037099 [Kingdonia uniflora]|uniref:Uncharacterized protein n=1 Tax=Kingdonia uniflora TaxID=39325 RepID=A0A7J7LHN9_9MAGN|nr:hypothetical protein GIB67_037099 [Kingdonia uniflora]